MRLLLQDVMCHLGGEGGWWRGVVEGGGGGGRGEDGEGSEGGEGGDGEGGEGGVVRILSKTWVGE